jgi:membrane protein
MGAYYTVFSLAPVLVLSVAVAGLAFGPEAASGRIVAELRGLMGADGAKAIEALIEHAALRPEAGWGATLLGVGFILIGASGAFGELRHALNRILDVEPATHARWLSFLRARAASFSLVLAIGFLLLVSLVVSAGLAALDDLVGGHVLEPVVGTLHAGVSLVVITLLFALMFRLLPDVRMPWGDILPGAAAAALLFVLGKYAIGFYLGNSAVASVYGAASSLAVLLIWVYYSAQVLFFGAELTQALGRRRELRA